MTMTVRPRVLVVDDEPMMLRSLARALRGALDIQTCPSGADALRVLEADAGFAVIVSDLRMPGMDGQALLQRARALAPGMAQVLLTATPDADRLLGDAQQIFRCLVKPVSMEELATVIIAAARTSTSTTSSSNGGS